MTTILWVQNSGSGTWKEFYVPSDKAEEIRYAFLNYFNKPAELNGVQSNFRPTRGVVLEFKDTLGNNVILALDFTKITAVVLAVDPTVKPKAFDPRKKVKAVSRFTS